MRMTRRSAIVIALVAGLVAALLTYFWLSKMQQKVPAREAAKSIQLVVPLHDITTGTVIRSEMLRTVEMSEEEAPDDGVHSAAQISGQVSLVDLPAGQPIKFSQVQAPTQLSYRVPKGMRAVTVAIDPVAGVAGFLKPGDRVDVIATFEVGKMMITRTILQNVELLAIGTTAISTVPEKPTTEGKETKAKPSAKEQPNATLAVDPEQAQKLILSDTSGKLRLALRSKFAKEYVSLPATDTVEVIGEEFEKALAAEEQPEPAPPETTSSQGPPRATLARETQGPAVEVIRGTEREIVVLGGSQTSSSARGGQ